MLLCTGRVSDINHILIRTGENNMTQLCKKRALLLYANSECQAKSAHSWSDKGLLLVYIFSTVSKLEFRCPSLFYVAFGEAAALESNCGREQTAEKSRL